VCNYNNYKTISKKINIVTSSAMNSNSLLLIIKFQIHYFLFFISLSSHSQNKKIGEGIGENQMRESKSNLPYRYQCVVEPVILQKNNYI
jgi:hypothetical protein